MPSKLKKLIDEGKIGAAAPQWLESNLHLEVICGSRGYGCYTENSDYDIRGIFTPPKVALFPASEGLVVGYDDIPNCEKFNPGHKFQDNAGNEYDFDLHSIAKFMRLAQENNPNQIDILYSNETNITHCSTIGRMIVDSRDIFLSKLCWKRFRGYAADQFKNVCNKNPIGGRKLLVEKYGYDVKFASHCIRLLLECEMILTEGYIDLTRNSAELNAIRRGEWSFEQLQKEFLARKLAIEQYFPNSKLPEVPDHQKVRSLLFDCLEHHYGSLSKSVVRPDATAIALRNIRTEIEKVEKFL